MEELTLKETWIEKLSTLGLKQGLSLDGSPVQSVYSAIWDHKHGELQGKKFRISKIKGIVYRVK